MRLLAAGSIVLLLVGPAASAQERDPAAADALFRQAREALGRGDYATACPKFVESQRLEPAVGTLMNIADCEEHAGRFASALEHWREAADQLAASPDDRLKLAQQRAGRLDSRVPRLSIRLSPQSPPDATVLRDGVELGSASLGTALPVNPGEHTIVVQANGREPSTKSVRLVEAQSLDLLVAPGPPRPATPLGPPAAHGTSALRTAGWVVGAVGLAALATAGITSVVIVNEKSVIDRDCPGRVCGSQAGLNAVQTGQALLVANAVAWVVGALGIGGGLTMLLAAKPTPNAPAAMNSSSGSHPHVTLVPTVDRTGAGLSVIRSF